MTEVILILDRQSLKVKIKVDKYSLLLTSFLSFFIYCHLEKDIVQIRLTFQNLKINEKNWWGFLSFWGKVIAKESQTAALTCGKKNTSADQLAQMEQQWSVDSGG